MGSGSAVSVGEITNNGRVLTISPLTESLLGNYTCTATNIRGSESKTLSVFGPPPPPLRIRDIDRNGNEATIRWLRPDSPDVVITAYKVSLYL